MTKYLITILAALLLPSCRQVLDSEEDVFRHLLEVMETPDYLGADTSRLVLHICLLDIILNIHIGETAVKEFDEKTPSGFFRKGALASIGDSPQGKNDRDVHEGREACRLFLLSRRKEVHPKLTSIDVLEVFPYNPKDFLYSVSGKCKTDQLKLLPKS